MGRSVYVAFPVMFVLAVVQTAVLPYFPIFSTSPLLPFLVALAWALVYRPEDGFIWAFVGGLFLDIFSANLLGINALAFVLTIGLLILIESALPDGRYITMLILSAGGTILYILLYTLLLRIWGFPISFNLILTLLPLILLHAILGQPIYWVLDKIDRVIRPRRVRMAE